MAKSCCCLKTRQHFEASLKEAAACALLQAQAKPRRRSQKQLSKPQGCRRKATQQGQQSAAGWPMADNVLVTGNIGLSFQDQGKPN